jgi:hypothetical protein
MQNISESRKSLKMKILFLVIALSSLTKTEIIKRCTVNNEQDLIECRQICIKSGGELS